MEKKYLIPTAIGAILLSMLVFTFVYKQTNRDLKPKHEVIETLAPKETTPIETKIAGQENNVTSEYKIEEPGTAVVVDNNGHIMSEEQAKEFEESMVDSMVLETITNEDGSESILDSNGNEIGVVADTGEWAQETMSGKVMEEIQENINDYTYKQSYERTREFIKLQVQLQKEAGNLEFMEITEEYINNASYEELDKLYIKILEVVGSGR